MLSSLQCGLRSIKDDARGALILLGDQPMVESETIDRLITAFDSTQKDIVIASHKQRRGHPILIGKKHFREVLALSEEQSLRDLLSRHPDDIEEVETGKTWVLRDIDTEQEYLEELNNQRT
jgi:molybdenum cofactor cytidylyltransferase